VSPPTPLEREHARSDAERPQLGVSRSVQRRRANAVRARRRRLLAIDLGLGVALALLALVLAPGLAILAIVAVAVLLACAASLLYGRARRSIAVSRSRAARGARVVSGPPAAADATPAAPRRD
jgi:Flp pilus assembly protein TadB